MHVEVEPSRLVWIAPGGGVEEGRVLEPGLPVWRRTHTFRLEQRHIRQHEIFFLMRTHWFEPQATRLHPQELTGFRGFRGGPLMTFEPRRIVLLRSPNCSRTFSYKARHKTWSMLGGIFL